MNVAARFLEHSSTACDEQLLFGKFNELLGHFGVTHCAVGEVHCSSLPSVASKLRDEDLLTNYPEAWISLYKKRDFCRVDPVITHADRMSEPYYWADLVRKATPHQNEVLSLAEDFGVSYGITVPFQSSNGSCTIVSMAREADGRLPPSALAELQSMSMLFHTRVQHIRANRRRLKPAGILTGRQLECMYWITRGKSSWDISKILGISENTVNYHIQQVLRHFDTSSRMVAAIQCIKMGLLLIE